MACLGSQHSVAGSLRNTLRSASGEGRCKAVSRPAGSGYPCGHRDAAALAECRYQGAASSRRLDSKVVWSHNAGSMGPPADAEVDPPDRHCDSLFVSKYDREIVSVALPALMAMLLEPAMTAVNSGGCIDLQCGVLLVHTNDELRWGSAGSHGIRSPPPPPVPSALVGRHLGTQQLGAVSVGSLAVTFCSFLFSFLLFLTTPEIAAAVAQRDPDKVSGEITSLPCQPPLSLLSGHLKWLRFSPGRSPRSPPRACG